MEVDFNKVNRDCLAATRCHLGVRFDSAEPFAGHAFMQFSEDAAFLAGLHDEGRIDDEELQQRLDMQKLAVRNVLLSIDGIGLTAAEDILNEMMRIVSSAVSASFHISMPI